MAEPCKCHNSHAYVVPLHIGHCCFFPEGQTCHTEEVAAWVAERGIAKVKSDERQSLLEELTADAEHEARIGEQGNDSERVNAAEKIIEMLNDIQIEEEA